MKAVANAPTRSASSRRMRGFEQTAGLLRDRIRTAGASRGFAVTRLLTHWPEIVGTEVARMARPVKVGFRRDGLGATLTLLTTGAQAPMLEMQKESIRERVNACYGYAAISKVLITQTAPGGFAEGQVAFAPAPASAAPPPDPEIARRAADAVADVGDAGLRAALENLGRNILARTSACAPNRQDTDPEKGPVR
ncbi:hypothetical protein ABIE69_003157 [Rhodobacteraceae bacterium MBR-64]